MIRLATIQNATSIGRLGVRQLAKTRSVYSPSSTLVTRSFSDSKDEKPKGIPYSKLTVGVPKETFPLEKRVAATPEVSSNIGVEGVGHSLSLLMYPYLTQARTTSWDINILLHSLSQN